MDPCLGQISKKLGNGHLFAQLIGHTGLNKINESSKIENYIIA